MILRLRTAAFVLALVLLDSPMLAGIVSAVVLGLGTAMVYPALIASISDHAHPSWRANALGTYRFWRDLGYAAGALLAGILADALGLTTTVIAAAGMGGVRPSKTLEREWEMRTSASMSLLSHVGCQAMPSIVVAS